MTQPVYLVLADGSKEMPAALSYAARAALQSGGRVALLKVVEVETIETWGGVERAVLDDVFSGARKEMASYEKEIEETTGAKPQTFYRKGETSKVLLDLIESEAGLSVLVLAANTKEGGANPLIRFLTSDKGLRKMKLPLLIVPPVPVVPPVANTKGA